MMALGIGLAIVVTNDGRNDVTVAAFQAWNVAIESQVFAVLVMSAMADAVPDVVEEGAGFELDAGLRRKMMNSLELIKEHEAEFADMFGVLLIVLQATAKASRGKKHLARFGIIAMRLLARESFVRDFLE